MSRIARGITHFRFRQITTLFSPTHAISASRSFPKYSVPCASTRMLSVTPNLNSRLSSAASSIESSQMSASRSVLISAVSLGVESMKSTSLAGFFAGDSSTERPISVSNSDMSSWRVMLLVLRKTSPVLPVWNSQRFKMSLNLAAKPSPTIWKKSSEKSL